MASKPNALFIGFVATKGPKISTKTIAVDDNLKDHLMHSVQIDQQRHEPNHLFCYMITKSKHKLSLIEKYCNDAEELQFVKLIKNESKSRYRGYYKNHFHMICQPKKLPFEREIGRSWLSLDSYQQWLKILMKENQQIAKYNNIYNLTFTVTKIKPIYAKLMKLNKKFFEYRLNRNFIANEGTDEECKELFNQMHIAKKKRKRPSHKINWKKTKNIGSKNQHVVAIAQAQDINRYLRRLKQQIDAYIRMNNVLNAYQNKFCRYLFHNHVSYFEIEWNVFYSEKFRHWTAYRKFKNENYWKIPKHDLSLLLKQFQDQNDFYKSSV